MASIVRPTYPARLHFQQPITPHYRFVRRVQELRETGKDAPRSLLLSRMRAVHRARMVQ